MFHEVKILNPKGKLKKLISSQELRQEHWRKFNELSHEITIGKFSRGRVPQSVRHVLESEFHDHEDEFR
ncbi:MAG: hypothetical protein NPINA01_23520 [Nitrospinaceae bacterium]|nr:MAG: hypothetical protein NPINA01_23520 [Nitrospinaceae bacterium]